MVQHVICPKCEKNGHKIQLVLIPRTGGKYVCVRCRKKYTLAPKG